MCGIAAVFPEEMNPAKINDEIQKLINRAARELAPPKKRPARDFRPDNVLVYRFRPESRKWVIL